VVGVVRGVTRGVRAEAGVTAGTRATCRRAGAPSGAAQGVARARIAPFLSRIRGEPAGDDIITGWMVRAGRGAHSVLKATFMALEAGDVSLAGVVLEAHEV
jgi:hypothetical protein